MDNSKAPITLRSEPITECILPRRKGAANVTQTATMIALMPCGESPRLKASLYLRCRRQRAGRPC